jgi:hypothetical protein
MVFVLFSAFVMLMSQMQDLIKNIFHMFKHVIYLIMFGFKVKRPGDKNVRCTILLLLDYQPLQFKLDPRLARLLGVHTQTRPAIISALWQYIKTHRLQVCMSISSEVFQLHQHNERLQAG